MFSALEVFTGFLDFRCSLDLPAEVCRIQLTVQDSLVDFADLCQGEEFTQQVIGDGPVGHFVAQPPQGVVHNRVVVEGQFREPIGPEPPDVLGFVGQGGFRGLYQGPVDNRHDPLGGRAVQAAESVELFEVLGSQPRGFAQVAGRGILEGFVVLERSAGQCPHVLERFADAAHQRQPQRGRPELSLGRRAKITVDMANDGGASLRSATFAEVAYTVLTPLLCRRDQKTSYSQND
ncbi:hypothetical protein AHiyo8_57420 [Arthrobacter sp. Hiyo8]|nr:hypothetical protein AHiyo8_57420 [Arthrobacter sp. Hiyo8]